MITSVMDDKTDWPGISTKDHCIPLKYDCMQHVTESPTSYISGGEIEHNAKTPKPNLWHVSQSAHHSNGMSLISFRFPCQVKVNTWFRFRIWTPCMMITYILNVKWLVLSEDSEMRNTGIYLYRSISIKGGLIFPTTHGWGHGGAHTLLLHLLAYIAFLLISYHTSPTRLIVIWLVIAHYRGEQQDLSQTTTGGPAALQPCWTL